MRFKDRVIVITGGTSGIGLETARRFLQEGAYVIVAATNEERGANALKELSIINGPDRVDYVRCNIREEDDIKALMNFTDKKYGMINTLCNNAAVDDGADLEHSTTEEWNKTLETNLRGPFLCTKYALPLLKKNVEAYPPKDSIKPLYTTSVVNTASELGIIVCLDMIPYNSSKGGLLHLSRAMALDLARYKIRVNTVCPAATETPFLHSDLTSDGRDYDTTLANITKDYPLGRIAYPEDIAPQILNFASEESGFVTGQHIVVDGGLTIK